MTSRLSILAPALAAFLISCGGPQLPDDPGDQILFRACAFLWSMQSEDGGWHSETHGLMQGGEATTAFVLDALLNAGPVCRSDQAEKDRALGFIRSRVSPDGVLGLSDPDIVDYPNYATAYALKIIAGHGTETDQELVWRMRDYLVSQQFDEDRGVPFSHPAYGGWGFGETTLSDGRVGHVDLSQTRRVLEAIRLAGHANEDTYNKASSFLRLHQKDASDERVRRTGVEAGEFDGGFFASAALPVVNKSEPVAQSDGTYIYTSYATATADGALALIAAGLESDDERVVAAQRWLSTFPEFAYPAGIPVEDLSRWGHVMFFYHIMVRAEAYRALAEPGVWREAVVELLRDRQLPEGQFTNPYGAPNKEDDPLIATAMVVVALSP